MNLKQKCLNPDHADRAARRNGLCSTCYQYACAMIRGGQTTWEVLEKEGKADLSTSRKAQAMKWLLSK
jgi:hypothetical protein